MTKIAINGLGRIGRAVFKQLVEDGAIELVAVNDLASAEELAYSSTTRCMADTDVTCGWRTGASSSVANPASC